MPRADRTGRGRRAGLFLLIVTFVVAIDQVSKLWIRSHLAPWESFPEVGCLRLVHVQNTGAAFGLFVNQTFLLTIVAVVGLVVILLFYRYLTEFGVVGTLTLGLIFGGAVGNLIDRLRLGHVTDFIDVRLWHDYHWPAFNVADSAITVGAIALACFTFWMLRKQNDNSSGVGS